MNLNSPSAFLPSKSKSVCGLFEPLCDVDFGRASFPKQAHFFKTDELQPLWSSSLIKKFSTPNKLCVSSSSALAASPKTLR